MIREGLYRFAGENPPDDSGWILIAQKELHPIKRAEGVINNLWFKPKEADNVATVSCDSCQQADTEASL